ncbi:esterase/lipase family protein [Sphingomonas aracearum]|uniref:esterase/lipase family protein n=1 Tax=Sphingomonas aracearum TaxID=2283317 RepID=UPI001EF147B7|nr:alpha/beta hydrolase [Sphingomonas aracearum]
MFGLVELGWRWRELAHLPRGDGRPVLILPGLFNTDRSTIVLRRSLQALGYHAEGWGLGRNLGARSTGAELERLLARVAAMAEDAGEPVTLIGISLGGIMARLAAHRAPTKVREVITIASPFAGDPRDTNVWRAFEWATGERVGDPFLAARSAEGMRPLPVPSTAIWSATDGLVNGNICRIEGERCIEVRSSHLWVQHRVSVLTAVAEVLASAR